MTRNTYVVAYDISNSKERRRLFRYLQNYSASYQKSCFECHMTPIEIRALIDWIYENLNGDKNIEIFQVRNVNNILRLGTPKLRNLTKGILI